MLILQTKQNLDKQKQQLYELFNTNLQNKQEFLLKDIYTSVISYCQIYLGNLLENKNKLDLIIRNRTINKTITLDINGVYDEAIAYFKDTLSTFHNNQLSMDTTDDCQFEDHIHAIYEYNHSLNHYFEQFQNLKSRLADTIQDHEIAINELNNELVLINSVLLKPEETVILQKAKSILSSKGELVIKLFEKIKSDLRNKFSIICDDEVIFRHDLMTLLYIYYLHSKELKSGEKFLFIDEGQDYSYCEFRLLKMVNGNKVNFNIFGDINQLLVNRGMSDWKQLIIAINANYYELNENYRNTIEITDFCNSQFNYEILPIGIHGPIVEKAKSNDIYDIIKAVKEDNSKTRIAIISKVNLDILHKRIKKRYASDTSILVGSVPDVKGLEFDTVFVITDSMSKNESYISYTRALNHLYIIGN